jgi:hypothetical protein
MAQVRITRRPAKRRMVDKAELSRRAASAGRHQRLGARASVSPKRLWRLDVAFPVERLAIEVEGFAAGGQAGRHQRVVGFTADCGEVRGARDHGLAIDSRDDAAGHAGRGRCGGWSGRWPPLPVAPEYRAAMRPRVTEDQALAEVVRA